MKFSKETQRLLHKLYQGKEHVSLSISVLNDGKMESFHFDEKKKRTDERLIYPVGSIGKVFTASLFAREMAAGKISLEYTIDQMISGLPDKYYPDMKRLLTHHSGYGGIPFGFMESLFKFAVMNTENGILHINPFRGYPEEADMLQILCEKKLKDQEYKFEYSNFAYGVLGYILGKINDTDYFGVMEDYIKELGLKETSLNNSSMTGYDKKGNACKPWQWERGDIIAPAGALLSSMEDLLCFAKINMEENYLSICHEKHAEGEAAFDQGLGWRLKKDSSISYHVGNAGAFSCILAMDRNKKVAVAIGMNYAMVDEIENVAFCMLEEM